MTLLNRQWQAVDGTRQVQIYPYLRRPDILSSNAYVFDTPQQIVLIDPGAQADQSQELLAVVRALLKERPRPLVIYLTHCHIDHALHTGLYHAFRGEAPVWIAVHQAGAETLASGDPRRTVSDLYNVPFNPVAPDILLLPPQHAGSSHRDIVLQDRYTIPVATDALATTISSPLYRKTIPLGGEDFLEWYPTPGHSPESVCMKVGRLLVIGDILSAVNPMVAGSAGWSQQDFIRSTSHLIWLLENSDVAWCCPGHGSAMPAAQVIELLKKVRRQAERLTDIAEMDVPRLHRTTEFARELLEEAEEVFAAMAGRLALLAFHLEELEEAQLAGQYRQLLDADKIEECLQSLRALSADLQAGQRLEVDFAVRALAIFQKIGSLFDQEKLQGIIPPAVSNRARTLLLDFINSARGLRNPEELVATDLNGLVAETVRELLKSPHEDLSIVETADDAGKFLAALATRLAYVPLFENVRLAFSPGDGLPLAHVGAARIADTLADLLTFLAGRDCAEILLSTACNEAGCEIRIRCPGSALAEILGEAKRKSFSRRFAMGGLALADDGEILRLKTG